MNKATRIFLLLLGLLVVGGLYGHFSSPTEVLAECRCSGAWCSGDRCCADCTCGEGRCFDGDYGNQWCDWFTYDVQACWPHNPNPGGGGDGDSTPPACTDVAVTGKASLTSPTASDIFDSSAAVAFSWSESGISWGKNCSGGSNTHQVVFGAIPSSDGDCGDVTSTTAACSVNSGTVTCSGSGFQPNYDYCWRVVSSNGASSVNSAWGRFSTYGSISGALKDQDTNENLKSGDQITDEGEVIIPSSSTAVVNYNKPDGTYFASEVEPGDQVICGHIFALDRPNFRYKVVDVIADVTASIISHSCVLVESYTKDVTADLVYDIFPVGWLQVFSGDIYSGAEGVSISVGIPSDENIKDPFSAYLTTEMPSGLWTQFGDGDSPKGNVFGVGDIQVANSANEDRINLDGNSAKNIDGEVTWFSVIDFIPPESAEDVTDTGLVGLDPNTVYKISASDLNDKIANSPTGSYSYSLSDSGVVVVFVTGSSEGAGDADLRISKNIQSADNERRILFIVDGGVTVSKEIGSETVSDLSQQGHIEAAFIAQDGIKFEAYSKDDGANYRKDKTIIVESPLVVASESGGSIDFDRDRGYRDTDNGEFEDNEIPAHMIRYNPIYLTKLSEQVKSVDDARYKGVAARNVTWIQWIRTTN